MSGANVNGGWVGKRGVSRPACKWDGLTPYSVVKASRLIAAAPRTLSSMPPLMFR